MALKNNKTHLTQANLLTIAKKTSCRCAYCNTLNATDIDHFFPNYLYKEWQLEEYTDNNSLDNLFLSCNSCNRKKGKKHPEDFLGGNWKTWSWYHRVNSRVGLLPRVYEL